MNKKRLAVPGVFDGSLTYDRLSWGPYTHRSRLGSAYGPYSHMTMLSRFAEATIAHGDAEHLRLCVVVIKES